MIWNEDCIEGSKKYIKDKSIDLIICDPPFGINETKFEKHYNRNDFNIIDGYVEAPNDYNKFTLDWLTQAKRILKDNGSIYIISGWSNLHSIYNAIEKLDLFEVNHIIWKFNFGVATTKKWVSSHYHILYLTKDKNIKTIFNKNSYFSDDEKDKNNKSLLYKDMEDVWIINKEYSSNQLKNQNKLPEKLIEKIILYSSNEKDIICDFFMGNFTTAMVAKKLNRQVFGFELNKNSYDYFIKIFKNIETGSGLCQLRIVPINKNINRGKKISEEERYSILNDFKKLNETKSKKESIDILSDKYKRGNFSIINILKIN